MKRLLMIAPLWLPWAARAHTLTASPAEQGAEPWVLALLALAMVLYAIGNARLYARARQSRLTLMLQSAFFAAGWMALLAALASPLDAAGSRSFAAHMVQHELLMIVAAPLLVLGRPLGVWIWAWPAGARRDVGAA
ncbi:cytochrome c oxidase assembly protein, partial [Duganella callida]